MCRAFRCARRPSSSPRRSSRTAVSGATPRSPAKRVEGAGAAVRASLLSGSAAQASAAGRKVGERCAAAALRHPRARFQLGHRRPDATRYLAAMGAEIIKIEAPGRGDPGRASELHTVLGQGKRGIVLDLKKPEAIESRAARRPSRRAGREFRDRGHGPARARAPTHCERSIPG